MKPLLSISSAADLRLALTMAVSVPSSSKRQGLAGFSPWRGEIFVLGSRSAMCPRWNSHRCAESGTQETEKARGLLKFW